MVIELPPTPGHVLDAFAEHVAVPIETPQQVSSLMLGLSTDLGEAVNVMLENLQLGAESRLALAEKLCDFACGWTRLCDAFALRPSSVAVGLLPADHVHVHMPFKERSLTAMRMVTACGGVNQLVDAWVRGGSVDKIELRNAMRVVFGHWATLCHQCGISWRHVLGLAAGSAKKARSRHIAG